MADSVKMIAIYLGISIMLYLAQVTDGGNKLFGDDIFTDWLEKDANTGDYTHLSANVSNATDRIYNPSSTGVGAITGTTVLNFWDITQLIWGFITLLLNIFFAIPIALLSLAVPGVFKMLFIVPMVIIGITIYILTIFGRK